MKLKPEKSFARLKSKKGLSFSSNGLTILALPPVGRKTSNLPSQNQHQSKMIITFENLSLPYNCLDTDQLMETSLTLYQILFNCLRGVLKEMLFIVAISMTVEIIPDY